MNLISGSLRKLIIHYVGSKNNLDPLFVSHQPVELNEELKEALQESFLSRFRNESEYFSFHHPSSLKFNEVFNFCRQLFLQPEHFEEHSISIAKHLYESSTHPKVKGGE